MHGSASSVPSTAARAGSSGSPAGDAQLGLRDLGRLGLIDIANPAKPVLLPPVDVRLGGVGEPASVAATRDGR